MIKYVGLRCQHVSFVGLWNKSETSYLHKFRIGNVKRETKRRFCIKATCNIKGFVKAFKVSFYVGSRQYWMPTCSYVGLATTPKCYRVQNTAVLHNTTDQVINVNIEACSRNQCCSGKAINIKYEIKWNANLMQLGNFINIFLVRHVWGTYAHYQEH